ncbi:hypothetical protein AAG906_038887 [Vitis piasezkii]
MPVSILPVDFRMPEIERYTSVGCPRIHLRLYNTIMRALGLDEAQLLTLFPLEKVVKMIERPTKRDQMCMFLRSLQPRELLDHLRAMEAYVLRAFSIDDLVIISTLDHCKYLGVISHPHSIVILSQFNSILLCIVILPQYDLYLSFSVHILVSHDMSSLVPGCLWIELLSDSELLMADHHTDYCVSLRHTIQDLIDSGAVSFLVSTTDTDLGPDMTVDSFLAYSTHVIPSPSGLYHHVLDTQGTDIHKTL